MKRVSKEEITGAVELLANSVYDLGGDSWWINASFDEWAEAGYSELISWKSTNGGNHKSHENRFDGKASIVKAIEPILKKGLYQLKQEGYQIRAI